MNTNKKIIPHNGYVIVRGNALESLKVYKSEANSLDAYKEAEKETPMGCVVSTFDWMAKKYPESVEADIEPIWVKKEAVA